MAPGKKLQRWAKVKNYYQDGTEEMNGNMPKEGQRVFPKGMFALCFLYKRQSF